VSEEKTHHGGCHCGAVRFEIRMAIGKVLACNCSICTKSGTLLQFVPRDRFTLVAGGDELREYRFNQHVIAHQFCSRCGIKPFAYGQMPDGSPMAAINVRCLDGVEVRDLEVTWFDGRNA
jgi:hypothetical protein